MGLRNVAHFQNDERIEVFHYANDCVRPRQGVGYWMMFSPGSGIFFNLGTTLSFDDGYNAACRYFNGAAALCSTCCTPVHRHIIRSARVPRISSIQIRGSRPGGLKLRRFEVTAVNSDCDANNTDDMGACPLDGDLTRTDGSVCLRNPMKPHINCDHHAPFPSPDGGRRDEKDSSGPVPVESRTRGHNAITFRGEGPRLSSKRPISEFAT